MDKAIKWFEARKGKVTYSMAYRNGPNSYDCSSSVYYALIEAGIFPSTIWIGNTESMFRDLPKYGFTRYDVGEGSIDAQRGDIFIWGRQGASSGGAGHTGIFLDPWNIIHCSYGYNGIHVDNHDWLSGINGGPYLTIFRYTGKASTPAPVPTVANNPNDQLLEVGSTIKFTKPYTVDDLQIVGGVWQVRTNELCSQGFTWNENGIPAEPVVEVDADGYATDDQELDIGGRYVIPGKYKVLDLGNVSGMWLAQIEMAGMKTWVDVATATEISDAEGGTPLPSKRPAAPAPVNTPPSSGNPIPATPTPVTEPKPTNNPSKPETVELGKQSTTLIQDLNKLLTELLALLKNIFNRG